MSIPILSNLLREFRGAVIVCRDCRRQLVLHEASAAAQQNHEYCADIVATPLRYRAAAVHGYVRLKNEWFCRACFAPYQRSPNRQPNPMDVVQAALNRASHQLMEVVHDY